MGQGFPTSKGQRLVDLDFLGKHLVDFHVSKMERWPFSHLACVQNPGLFAMGLYYPVIYGPR